MASSSSSSDVTMTTLSGTADSSDRSRDMNPTYRPVRGRSESVPRRALPAAPYDNQQLKAIMDADRDVESGLESEDHVDPSIGALLVYKAKVTKEQRLQATAIAERDRQIEELQRQLASANNERKKWIEKCEESIVSADRMEDQIDNMADTHVSRERANEVLNYAVKQSRDQERQATVQEATAEHNQIVGSLKSQG